jgi:hypothetical protein
MAEMVEPTWPTYADELEAAQGDLRSFPLPRPSIRVRLWTLR